MGYNLIFILRGLERREGVRDAGVGCGGVVSSTYRCGFSQIYDLHAWLLTLLLYWLNISGGCSANCTEASTVTKPWTLTPDFDHFGLVRGGGGGGLFVTIIPTYPSTNLAGLPPHTLRQGARL